MILATLCYIRSKEKTLMVLRNKKKDDVHEGKYNGLGGKLESGESPEECVIREVQEESGLTIKPELRGFISFPKFSKGRDWYVFLFTAHEYTGVLREDCPEGDLVWVETDKLLELSLWEGDKLFLSWLNQDRFFSAKFNYIDGSLTNHSVVFY